jgi:sugar-specific transcriptional regulator TrmB
MNIEKSLESLGLTQMEALAYAYLVANPSSTGYRVARGIGKPTANVYRALESLGRKGAVMQERAATPLFKALSPEDLLARLEQDFIRRKAIAARELAAIRPDESDERVYALKSMDQVLARARIVLASARRLTLMDAGRDLLAVLSPEIEDARSRGVRVLVRARATPASRGAGDADHLAHADTLSDGPPTPGEPPSLRIASDAREVLLASFARDEERVRDALWTRSAFLARSVHESLASERCCLQIELKMADGLNVDEVEAAFEEWRTVRAMV